MSTDHVDDHQAGNVVRLRALDTGTETRTSEPPGPAYSDLTDGRQPGAALQNTAMCQAGPRVRLLGRRRSPCAGRESDAPGGPAGLPAHAGRNLLAARGRHLEAGVGVEAAHQRVPAAGADLDGL
jgi:hypothetical protein